MSWLNALINFFRSLFSKSKTVTIGGGTIIAVLTSLFLLTQYGIGITTTGNITCAGNLGDPCVSYMNITTQQYALLFPTAILSFDHNVNYNVYRNVNGVWLETDLSNYRLPANSVLELKLIGYKQFANQTVNWGISSGATSVDPVWNGVQTGILDTNSQRNCDSIGCTLSVTQPSYHVNPNTGGWEVGAPNSYLNVTTDSSGNIVATYFNETLTMSPSIATSLVVGANLTLTSKPTVNMVQTPKGYNIAFNLSSAGISLATIQKVNYKLSGNAPDIILDTSDLVNNNFNFTYNGTDLSIYPRIVHTNSSSQILPINSIIDPTLHIQSGATVECGSDTTDTIIEVVNNGELRICNWNGTKTTGYFNYTVNGGNLTIDKTSWINGTGAGNRGNSTNGCPGESTKGWNGTSSSACTQNYPNQPGGGGGGIPSSEQGAIGGNTYDDKTSEWAPGGTSVPNASLGSGGGACENTCKGGNGAAAMIVSLGASGIINLQGNITLNGMVSQCGTYYGGGGGSGGDFWARAGTINMTNTTPTVAARYSAITVTGGDGCGVTGTFSSGGGASAGRIKEFYSNIYGNSTAVYNLTGGMSETGGSGTQSAGAGAGNAGKGGNSNPSGTGLNGSNGTIYQTIDNTLSAPPQYYNNVTTITSPYTGTSSNSFFNVSFNNVTDQISMILFELNYTGSFANYTNTTFNVGATQTNASYYLSLGVGTYQWRAIGNTTAGYGNATQNVTVSITKGAMAGSISGTAVVYPALVNMCPTETNTGDTDVNYTFWRNTTVGGGTLVSSAIDGNPACDTSLLDVGTYDWILNSTGGANWTSNATIAITAETETKGNPTVNTYINNLTVNGTSTYPNILELRGNSSAVNSPPTFNLYVQNITTGWTMLLSTGNAAFNSSVSLGNGTWNEIYNTSGNNDWNSASNSTLNLTVQKGVISGITISGGSVTYDTSVNVVMSGTNNNEVDTDVPYNFYRNSTPASSVLVSSVTDTNPTADTSLLDAGTYSWYWTSAGGANWTVNTSYNQLVTYTVSKGTPVIYVWLNNTAANQTVYFPDQIDIRANTSQNNPPTVNLFMNFTNGTVILISNGNPAYNSTISWDRGLWQIIANTSSNSDWNANSNKTIFLNETQGADIKVQFNPGDFNVLFNQPDICDQRAARIVYPKNQTATLGVLNGTNNGTVTAISLDISLNSTPPSGYYLNISNATANISLPDTSWYPVYRNVAVGSNVTFLFYMNCTSPTNLWYLAFNWRATS